MATPPPKRSGPQPGVEVKGSSLALLGPLDSSCSSYMLFLHSIELSLLLTSQFPVTSVHVLLNNSDLKLSLFKFLCGLSLHWALTDTILQDEEIQVQSRQNESLNPDILIPKSHYFYTILKYSFHE